MGIPNEATEHPEAPWVFGMRHRLALALEVSGTSVQEMAEVLEVSPNTVGNYTSGRTTPKHATLAMWAMKTGAPLEWIKTGEEPSAKKADALGTIRKPRPSNPLVAHSPLKYLSDYRKAA